MSIPESRVGDKSGGLSRQSGRAVLGHISSISRNAVFLVIIILTGILCLGLGLLVQKQNAQPKDPLWIEQLPSSELPGSVSTSTSADAGMSGQVTPKTSAASATPQSDDPESKASTANSQPAAAAAGAAALTQSGNYVAAKTGTKYYLPTCATAKRIKDTNKVWFATKAQAEAAGYQAATNCKGI